ncbi:MAG: DUF58 domain-containing protein [Moraxella sp.]|nr:DUF58 domain-containing protein [Moraxella sp.]
MHPEPKLNLHTLKKTLPKALSACLPQLSVHGQKVLFSGLALLACLDLVRLFLGYQGLFSVAESGIGWVLWAVVLGLFGLFLFELVWLYHWRFFSSFLKDLTWTRTLNHNLSAHRPSVVTLVGRTSTAPKNAHFLLNDGLFAHAKAEALPVRLSADELVVDDGGAGLGIHYELVPFGRGRFSFDGVYLALVGRFGLLKLYHHVPESQILGQSSVRVFADFQLSHPEQMTLVAGKSTMDGQLKQKRRGLGQDFHQIRSYSTGDSLREVDWKATSRLLRLMSREFQDDKEQTLFFMVDSSSRMRHAHIDPLEPLKKISHLDGVLSTMLALSKAALKAGDSVGFMSFSGIDDRLVLPKKGMGVLNELVDKSFDIKPSTLMPDYLSAAKTLLATQKRRAFVVLLTSPRSESFEELSHAIELLRAKHLVLVATLYESDIAVTLDEAPQDWQKACRQQVVIEHLAVSRLLMAALQSKSGVYVLQSTPDKLPLVLTERYFALRQRLR